MKPLEVSMINLLGCLARSGAGAGAIAGSILGGPGEVAAPSGQGRPDRAGRMRSIRVMPRADSDRRFSGTPNALWAIPGPAIVALV